MWPKRSDDEYFYEDDEYASRRRWVKIAGAAVVVALGAGALWQLRPDGNSTASTDASESTDPVTTQPDSRSAAGQAQPSGSSRVAGATTSMSPAGATPTTTSSTAGVPAAGSTTTTVVPTPGASPIVSAGSVAPTSAALPVQPDLGYPTSPDGTPLPVVALFDTDTITITGQVPTEAAKTRLAMLAKANSQFPDAAVVNNVVVNAAVPISVGVRVIELNSVRFPEGTADILPAHASELDRVVTVMNALPNVTVLVVGHADQRGNEVDNFAISDERARVVVNYLRFLGISPTRLSSRAAGSSDLLSADESSTALALNRRTEFIFYGLLVE